MTTQMHTVRSFAEQLHELERMVLEMARLARLQTLAAVDALLQGDRTLAAETAERDAELDELHQRIEAAEHEVLATRQPVAQDLRAVVSFGRIARDLERVGDHATNVAEEIVYWTTGELRRTTRKPD